MLDRIQILKDVLDFQGWAEEGCNLKDVRRAISENALAFEFKVGTRMDV